MNLSHNSKRLITVIVVFTVLAVAVAGFFDETAKDEQSQAAVSPIKTQKLGSSAEKEADTLVRSLTNMSQIVDLAQAKHFVYKGYILGAGYASYQFIGKQNQQVSIKLGDNSQQLEMLLYGPTSPQEINGPMVLPEDGLYEVRVLFKDNIEPLQEQNQDNHTAKPVPYSLELSF